MSDVVALPDGLVGADVATRTGEEVFVGSLVCDPDGRRLSIDEQVAIAAPAAAIPTA